MAKTPAKVDNKENLPATPINQAVILYPEAETHANVPVPKEMTDADDVTSMTPVVDFQEEGDYIMGLYLGKREGIGPNNAMLYDLETADGEQVSVWGSTILNTKMQLGNPGIGDLVCIQYLGTLETKRGLQPAKNFRVRIKRMNR